VYDGTCVWDKVVVEGLVGVSGEGKRMFFGRARVLNAGTAKCY